MCINLLLLLLGMRPVGRCSRKQEVWDSMLKGVRPAAAAVARGSLIRPGGCSCLGSSRILLPLLLLLLGALRPQRHVGSATGLIWMG